MRMKVVAAGVLATMVTAAVAMAQTPPAPGPGGPDRAGRMGRMMQMSPEDRAAYLDARIASLKAVLRLTPEQERHWPAFETALREAAALRGQRLAERAERWREMREGRENRDNAQRPDPIQRLRAASDRMAETAAAMRKIADAGAPLYASLNEAQKRRADRIIMRRGLMGSGGMHGGMMGGWGRHHEGQRRGPGGEGGRL